MRLFRSFLNQDVNYFSFLQAEDKEKEEEAKLKRKVTETMAVPDVRKRVTILLCNILNT